MQVRIFVCGKTGEEEFKWMFPKIGGKPKWMVYNGIENPIKMDDLGVPIFLETPKWFFKWIHSLKLTNRPGKWMVGRRSFPFGMAYFQVRFVSFRECSKRRKNYTPT